MPKPPRSAYIVVGERLHLARVDRNLTQEEVAFAAGISVSYYGKLERGELNPSLEMLVRATAAIGVPLADVVADLTVAQLPERTSWPRRGPR